LELFKKIIVSPIPSRWNEREHMVMDTVGSGDVLWQRSNTARSSFMLKAALHASAIRFKKCIVNVFAMSLTLQSSMVELCVPPA
jgi:hypothetical protein